MEKILDGHGALKQGFLSSSVSYCISDDPDANEVGEAMDLYKVPVLTVSVSLIILYIHILFPSFQSWNWVTLTKTSEIVNL